MSVPALGDGRRMAESLMVDTCTITRGGGYTTTDPLTGETTEAATAVYTGRCKVKQRLGAGNLLDAGEAAAVIQRLELHLPIEGTADVMRGDVATIDAATTDPALLGRTFRVHDLLLMTYATARRLGIEEVT